MKESFYPKARLDYSKTPLSFHYYRADMTNPIQVMNNRN